LSAQVTVYLGPARSGKSTELLRRYAEVVRTGPLPLSRTLWLVPTGRAAAQLRLQLLEFVTDACLSPGVMTFINFAERILSGSQSRLRPIPPPLERELIRRAVREAIQRGELEFFAQAAQRDGFVDLVADHIRELRRHGINAPLYSRLGAGAHNSSQHQELSKLYNSYQQHLTANALVDGEGIVWAACDAMRQGAAGVLNDLALVVVDGFSDFTAAQHELLRLLAACTGKLLISLPSDDAPAARRTGRSSDQPHTQPVPTRPDLFAKSVATLAVLRRNFPQLTDGRFPPQRTSWPALDHIRQQLFQPPNRVQPASDEVASSLDRLEIVEAAGVHDEIIQVATRIKSLLTAPLPFRERPGEGSGPARAGDILVVFRSLGDAASRIREVFQQFGIPYFLETGQAFASTALCRTLFSLLRLHEEDWPFRRTVAVITNNTLSAIDGRARRAADWLVRDLQIAEGHAALLDRARQLAATSTPPQSLSEHTNRRIDEARAALPALELLQDALDKLPNECTASQWADALAQLGARLGLSPFVDSPIHSSAVLRTGRFSDQSTDGEPRDHSDSIRTDQIAWQLIVEHLSSLDRLDTWLGLPSRSLTRRELMIALSDLARHGTLPPAHDEVGRVRVLSAAAARTVRAKHVFLAGMSEQAFPSAERPGRLATESDYRNIARATNQRKVARQSPPASLVHESTRSQDEMLLFYEVLSSAEETLTISYPALDDKAQTLPPSPYVAEVRRTLGDAARSKLRVAVPQLSPIRLNEMPSHRAGWRIQAVARALEKEPRLLAGMLGDDRAGPLGAAVASGLRIVHARARRESFGTAEGLLTSPAAAARFAERFGPQHLWSPSQWETYATCPYRFFLENVLGVEPLGELALETDFARRGSRLHQVLAAFHLRWREACSDQSLSAENEAAEFLARFYGVVDERIAGAPPGTIDAALLELDRRQIRKWAGAHFEHHTKYQGECAKLGGAMSPSRFEFRFGSARPDDAESDPDSSGEAIVLEIEGEKIRITGQIDRIDVGTVDGKTVFNVIDYKSGKKVALKQDHIESGERLQLPIYVEAAQILLFGGDATPLAAGYWSMASGFDAKSPLIAKHGLDNDERWSNVQATVHRLVGQFVKAIRHGEFPVTSRDEHCTSHCDFNTICRITQIRSLGKIWSREEKTITIPPSAAPPYAG
jgi:ATP-dependent helicase/nuclease subunit B